MVAKQMQMQKVIEITKSGSGLNNRYDQFVAGLVIVCSLHLDDDHVGVFWQDMGMSTARAS